ncbi:MAG TPA: 30S ribosomal protein S16, partial [Treponemataceae bacterium]|nr:30S ribosomal protein S16 [Treponemataceae bacterium]
EDKQVSFDSDKVRKWINNGAQPTDTVRGLLNRNNFTL